MMVLIVFACLIQYPFFVNCQKSKNIKLKIQLLNSLTTFSVFYPKNVFELNKAIWSEIKLQEKKESLKKAKIEAEREEIRRKIITEHLQTGKTSIMRDFIDTRF